MKVVGITGGIGAGKSLVCEIFMTLGVPVFNADNEAKKLINTSDNLKLKLKAKFGNDIYDEFNLINKKKFGDIIFNDKAALEYTNSIVHPEVIEAFNKWKKKRNSCDYVLHEAAILFESGVYKLMDSVIYVYANEELRIDRVSNRDKVTHENVIERMENQWSFDKVKDSVDYVVDNDGIKFIIPQVLDIHNKIIKS